MNNLKELYGAIPEGRLDTHSGMVRRSQPQTFSDEGMTITMSRYPVAECYRLGSEHPVEPEVAEAYAKLFTAAVNSLPQWFALLEAMEFIAENSHQTGIRVVAKDALKEIHNGS